MENDANMRSINIITSVRDHAQLDMPLKELEFPQGRTFALPEAVAQSVVGFVRRALQEG